MTHREGRPVRQTIALNLLITEQPVLVVGGGQVGRRKTHLLLESGARVELICPQAHDELRALARAGRLVWHKRTFHPDDVPHHLLVFACTDDKHVNLAILQAARAAHVPCCLADLNWCEGDFTTPATAHVGELVLAISTHGQNCRTARDVKAELVAHLTEKQTAELILMGTSDQLLASRKRAPYHLPPEKRAHIGAMLKGVRGVREFFILNTCNRVELVVCATRAADVEAIILRLSGLDQLAPSERFVLTGFAAFQHLVCVASGLESSLLGEFHIVSQMKDALEEADAQNWSGAAIQRLGSEILRVSKSVRHEVEGLLRVAEIDQVAVRYLGVHGGLDASTHVVVIGTGMVGRGIVEGLAPFHAHVDWCYHVHQPTETHTATLHPLADLRTVLAAADIVVSAVDVAEPLVTQEMRDVFQAREVLLVDLGVPRNIDPFYDEYGHGLTVATLDDLKLWHRVKTGVLHDVRTKALAVIAQNAPTDCW